jgi:hypothetical protein
MHEDDELAVITEGYTRDRHWEIVYHDLIDLYGPKIGLDGIGLWVTYKRFIQHNPDHLLTDKAWPSHRGLLAPLFKVGQTSLRNTRRDLVDAGLIEVTKGRDLARRSQEDYDRQVLSWHEEGKPRKPVRRITLGQLAAMGIQNPSRTLFIEVNDPLSFHSFCERFLLTYSPQVTSHNDEGQPVWNMEFDDYDGMIRGPNRLLAATRYIENNLCARPADRDHWPLVTEQQIRSLLRCKPDDKETINIRRRMLERRAAAAGRADRSQVSTQEPTPLPDDVLSMLRRLRWNGPTAEVAAHFARDPDRVYELLDYWLEHRSEVDNPAAAFRQALRYASATAPDSIPDELHDLAF